MSHRLGRVVSDLSHSNSRGAAGQQGLHHQSTTTASNNHDRGNAGRARQRLALLFSGVVAWTRSESSSETGCSSSREKNKKQQQTANGGGAGARRRGLDIVLALRKYVSMVEQLFASYSSRGSSARRDGDGRDARRRRRPHTFTYARGGGGGASSSSSRRHKQGRQSSAPASLRGSPANSGHLAVGESVARKASTPSEVSTMEELHSAIQAAIAHCKSSAGGEPQQPRA
ncbi:probable BRI1 kinase inhibitor 1 [Panicum virgatum]|uniref:BRI1 kinase inhibitor 1 n=1 Tax=Panicum virgatum TaxID=38727 RepID=A0A8T0R254_PANVG|nr:probable BRI1 kinase inhibitor 1 [Panicum virgatum]KAG2579340.1 hypothetical protein PVAP13_6NG281000 [Panicum virgatum]